MLASDRYPRLKSIQNTFMVICNRRQIPMTFRWRFSDAVNYSMFTFLTIPVISRIQVLEGFANSLRHSVASRLRLALEDFRRKPILLSLPSLSFPVMWQSVGRLVEPSRSMCCPVLLHGVRFWCRQALAMELLDHCLGLFLTRVILFARHIVCSSR